MFYVYFKYGKKFNEKGDINMNLANVIRRKVF